LIIQILLVIMPVLKKNSLIRTRVTAYLQLQAKDDVSRKVTEMAICYYRKAHPLNSADAKSSAAD
jgi:hypothetical protein